jgi:hypothetical protein
MKFKKIVEAYYDFSDTDQGYLKMAYDDSTVGNTTYTGFVSEQLCILYDQADPATRHRVGDINWSQNYLARTQTVDNKKRTHDFDQETVLLVLDDGGLIQYAYFSSRNVKSDGFIQDTNPHFFTILSGRGKYIGIRGYVKVQRLSLDNEIRKLEVYKECGTGYTVSDIIL